MQMDIQLREKVWAKMLKKGFITQEEYESGDNIDQMVEMYVKGISLTGDDKTILGQIRIREELSIKGKFKDEKLETEFQKENISMLRKLHKVKDSFDFTEVVNKTGQAKDQVQQVQWHLEEKGSLTSWDAFKLYGITRLSAIIYKIRNRTDMVIESIQMKRKNRYGNNVVFVKYVLQK